MNILVTCSRMPFALDEIRKLGRARHRVFAADTFRAAPGSHSRWVAGAVRFTPPARSPARFLDDVERAVSRLGIELLIPCFEEVFYLARHLPALTKRVEVFASPLSLLSRLHHKGAFNALARSLGVPAPETTTVESRAELVDATAALPRFLARPAWSRGGISLYTNSGPLAGALRLEDCEPSAARPWVVQGYVDGEDVCSFSVARRGRVVAHCTYVHPRQIEHAGGIVFESVDEPEALACAQRVVEATGYHGQISFDFRRGRRGLEVIECNPRPTAGVHLMPDAVLVDAILGPPNGRLAVTPPGARRRYSAALVRDLVLHWDRFVDDLRWLARGGADVYGEPGDRLPALFQVLSLTRALAYRARHRRRTRRGTTLMAAYFDGVSWDGDPIP
jgi:predicted ATP-grasp superfamily ATP-dependent carboligase